MYIKKLQMFGFKSFADGTELVFEPGITSVVGPNGCGKSNISDAIRWVMGEQRAKIMRGERMGDVIFNGTETRKATGRAEVSITFADCENVLEPGLNEIAITRRLYSTGESEYLINKQVCRLKDIHELFMDTGMGARAYSIFEQGRMDQILNAKPHERRQIFEEAAGITRYITRKAEALRKLERTEQNLLRLQDIIRELTRQHRSLKRQASAARRFKEYRERIRDLEIRLRYTEYVGLKEAYKRSEDETARMKELVAESSGKRDTLNMKVQDGSLKHADFEKQIDDIQAELHKIDLEMEKSEGEIIALSERRQTQENLAERCREEMDGFERRTAEIQSRKEQKSQELGGLQARLAERQAEVKSQDEVVRSISRLTEETLGSIENIRSESEAMADEVKRLRSELQYCKLNTDVLNKTIDDCETKISERQRHLENLNASTVEYKRKKEDISQKKDELAGLRETHQTELLELRTKYTEMTMERDRLQQETSALQSRLEVLIELEETYQGYEQDVRVALECAQGTNQAVEVVANLITCQADHELAIEASLADSLQYIVAISKTDILSIIKDVKSAANGRATFMPISSVNGSQFTHPEVSFESDEGIVGWADDLIETSEQNKRLIQKLLGHVLVVDDFSRALQLSDKRTGDYRIVTLDGDVFYPFGAITAGKKTRTGIIGRKTEMQTLRNRLEDNRSDLDNTTKSISEYNSRIQSLEVQFDDISRAHHQVEIEHITTSSELTAIEEDSKRTSENLRKLTEERNMAIAKRDNVAGQISGLEMNIGSREEELTGISERLENVRDEYEERQAELEEARQALTHLQVLSAGLEEKQVALKEELNQFDQTIRENESYSQKKAAEIQEHIAAAENLINDISVKKETLDELNKNHETVKGELNGVIDSRDELQGSLDSLKNEMRSLEAELEERREELHRLDMELTERRLQADNIARQVRDEYQIDLEEYIRTTALKEAGVTEDEPEVEAEADDDQAVEAETETAVEAEKTEGEEDAEAEGEEAADGEKKAEAIDMDELLKNDDEPLDPEAAREELDDLKQKMQRIGGVNEIAINEFEDITTRLEFLTEQEKDMTTARDQLYSTINKINTTTRQLYEETFAKARSNFNETFRRFFGGGRADLVPDSEEADPLTAGVEIIARPPGKKLQHISLLSGGERALTALAVLFSLYEIKPSPYCLMDEVDAPLDDQNVKRFCNIIKDYAHSTQFIIITHNKLTMEIADALYGVTMEEKGISKLLSVKLADVDETLEAVPVA